MARIASVLALLSAALVVTGCGGDDGGSGGSGSSDAKRVVVADGETATFKGPNATFDVGIDVDIEEGSIDDLKDFRLEGDELKQTPWYVTSTYENRGDEDLTTEDAFGVAVEAFDDTGSEPKQMVPLGTFDRCKQESPPVPFPAGESQSSCKIFMVDEGAKLDEVVVTETRFKGDSIDHVWKAG
jgi:hypothetical protein